MPGSSRSPAPPSAPQASPQASPLSSLRSSPQPDLPGQISWWPAPAKLNLFLHVTGRYPDGYHALQTVFQLIDHCDRIGLALREDGRIERQAGLTEIEPERDLVVRAARLLQRHCRTRLGADIHVVKHIPAGGGLGGGSSDAATVLVALNRLWRLGLDPAALAELGLSLGADVPVFVRGESAWGEGRGERLTAIQLPPRWYLIVHPGIAVSTAEVFQAHELTRNSPVITMRDFSAAMVTGTWCGAAGAEPAEAAAGSAAARGTGAGIGNVCEPVVRARYPVIAEALDWLSAQIDGQGRPIRARMSGTGSCIFAAFERWQEAERIAARVPDRWRSFVARGLDLSPLRAML